MRPDKILVVGFVLLSPLFVACSGQDNELPEELQFEEPEELVEVPELTEEQVETEEIVSAEEIVDRDQVVVIVNGEEVYGDRYNLVYFEIKNSLTQSGEVPDDLAVVRESAMLDLIKQTLLAQDAAAKGIIVTDQETEAIFQDTKAQFDSEEEFEQILAQLPYTEAVFREILAKSLLQQYYINDQFSDIRVSSDDIEAFYAILSEQMEEAPELDEIRTEIHNQLLQTEIQMALNDRLNQLIGEAEIEEKLP
ncbi:SurA N-terminal domain-containing protein [Amphibacillus indicireducens]|uniref:Peptidylprolyl isomerase n=1 Tax=Amphibacillus indicireducens TaxID=1076330 RepID=A0ABP7VRA6_9BACI